MKLMKSCFLRHLFTLLLLLCTVVTTSKAEMTLYDGETFCFDGLGYRVLNAKERIVASSTVLNMEKPSGSYISEIKIGSNEPTAITASSNIFADIYSKAILYVPLDCKNKYEGTHRGVNSTIL